jgi:hypothetical protein
MSSGGEAMDTNGNIATTRNGTALTNGRLSPQPQGVSVVKAKALRHGIALYGQVCASDGRTWYTVKKKRTGKYRFTYYCSCPGSFLGEYHPCRHIALFKLAEASGRSNGCNGRLRHCLTP